VSFHQATIRILSNRVSARILFVMDKLSRLVPQTLENSGDKRSGS
jgi:hypothetical protein